MTTNHDRLIAAAPDLLAALEDAEFLLRKLAAQSSDFQDGGAAAGFWVENGTLFEQVVGSSGVYLIETDIETGDTIRDSRPWQMRM